MAQAAWERPRGAAACDAAAEAPAASIEAALIDEVDVLYGNLPADGSGGVDGNTGGVCTRSASDCWPSDARFAGPNLAIRNFR
jgi:hypothetical protein